MKRLSNLVPGACAALLVATWSPAGTAMDGEDQRVAIEEARKIADMLVNHVRGELTKALETSGPLRSVVVCKYNVPEISSSVSRKTGWRVTRVSLRPRNPALGAPDAWEQKVLMQFDQRAARGERPDAIEHSEVVGEPAGRFFRYMRALPTGPLCLGCHGPVDGLSEAVRAQIALEYPQDRAVGYRTGQIRGAVTVKRPID